jgi:hypothetical protein
VKVALAKPLTWVKKWLVRRAPGTRREKTVAWGAPLTAERHDVGRLIQTRLPKTRLLENRFTKLQGQYLAFIVAYTKLNRRAPAEADLQRYFEVTPPSVHGMIVTLERRGLIRRTPGQARSIEVLVPLSDVPPLD